jgi:hypothetical protein
MHPASPKVKRYLDAAMIARVATVSSGGKPRITPLWFVHKDGRLYLNARADSPAVKAIRANASVVVLLSPEKARTRSRKVLKLKGTATFEAGKQYSPGMLLRFALKYYLSPGGVRSFIASRRTMGARARYYRERAGEAGGIEITPEGAEITTPA